MIRLSTAHAKLHQSREIEIRDCVEAFRLMIYCLEGDSHALDNDLKEILRKLGLEDAFYFEKGDEKQKGHKVVKKEMKKMEDESFGIVQKMSKIDIHKDEKEAEAVIKRAMTAQSPVNIPKEKRSLVFRAITELKKQLKTDKGHITLK